MSKTKGIVLVAFGKRGYFLAARNMAMSIKSHNPNIPITLLYNGKLNIEFNFFDKMVSIPNEIIYRNGKIDPGYAKVSLYDYLPYDENLYLDVDGLVLKDLQPLIDQLSEIKSDYITERTGKGGKDDLINYTWIKDNNVTWKLFNLKEDQVFYTVQSSFAYIKKSAKSKKIFDTAKKYFEKGINYKELQWRWGGTLPDELFFGGACSKLNHDPSGGVKPIFFGRELTLNFKDITEQYYITSIYGNGTGRPLVREKYLDWYDRLLAKYCRAFKSPLTGYQTVYIRRDKHANN